MDIIEPFFMEKFGKEVSILKTNCRFHVCH